MGERTWRVRQEEIVQEVGVASGSKKFDLKMEGLGSYKLNYTRNGR
jgi:U3 small nucleolar RNA-associated protein 7